MSYHIYTTPGVVLSARSVREADRIYSILTRDLGLIQATAIGVRKGESKHRGSLEPFTISSISLVRGKEYWRITSAESLRSVPNKEEIARPLALLEKLVQGEAHNPELYNAVESAIWSTPSVDHDEMWEIGFVAQILFHLGYLKEADLSLEKKDLITAINEGLRESHLN
ncbi:MAG: DNA repair protein RecO [Candidatus Zambryskibacteria bacterium]|nr:DNA repair protein RecO [Candidatus Zambryskibacteria bacterium]